MDLGGSEVIFILDGSLNTQGVIKSVITATREEELNGSNTLEFEATLDDKLTSLVSETSIFMVSDDYYDLAYMKKSTDEDGENLVEIQAEHVSYRLNNEEFDIEFFTEMGTPTYIFGKLLEGTPFTVGTVELTEEVVYSVQQTMSRRQAVMEFGAYVAADLIFDKFVISLVAHRGSVTPKPTMVGKNVETLSKTVDKRKKDENGNIFVNYTCKPYFLPGDMYELGDNIRLIHPSLSIDLALRLVSIATNPYDPMATTIQFSSGENGLAKSLYRINYDKVVLDQSYNGARIGPQYGFESVRNDKKARAYFRSDGMKFQTGDGTGENWTDRLYYEYNDVTNETILVFDGVLSAYVIQALKAEIDIVVSNTIIVNNLYAEYGRIANLSVAELDTSWKMITNYLLKDIDLTASLSDVNYQRIYEDASETWTAEVMTNNNPTNVVATVVSSSSINLSWSNTTGGNTTQYTNKDGTKLYWVDNTLLKGGMTTNDTGIPVMVYTYKKLLKKVESMELVNGIYTVRTWYGAGLGVDNRGRAYNLKDTNGWIQGYIRNNNEAIEIELGEDGIIQRGNTGPTGLRNIIISADMPTVETLLPGDVWLKYS